jgi:hypothetical protein
MVFISLFLLKGLIIDMITLVKQHIGSTYRVHQKRKWNKTSQHHLTLNINA